MFANIQLRGHHSILDLYHTDHILSMTQIRSLPGATHSLPQPREHRLAGINKLATKAGFFCCLSTGQSDSGWSP